MQLIHLRLRLCASLIFDRYLLSKTGGNQIHKQADDDAAEDRTFAMSGVKDSYGTPRRANDATAPQDDIKQQNGQPLPGSSDQPNGPAAEAVPRQDDRDKKKSKWNKGKKEGGQNKKRNFGMWGDKLKLCSSVQFTSEFSPQECKHGDKCKYTHSIRKYLDQEGKVNEQEGEANEQEGAASGVEDRLFKVCPVWEENGFCPVGWQCRYIKSHSKEVEHDDGKTELVLVQDEQKMKAAGYDETTKAVAAKVQNTIGIKDRIDLERRRVDFEESDQYVKWLTDAWNPQMLTNNNRSQPYPTSLEKKAEAQDVVMKDAAAADKEEGGVKLGQDEPNAQQEAKTQEQQKPWEEPKADTRAGYKEPPFRPSEKRRLYYGPETPVLAPLTTQGNLPFRRLCVGLGAQVTWSEMSMGLPLIQGQKNEWALVKSYESEMKPPTIREGADVIEGYDNSRDMKFGVQVAANKPWIAFKATQALAKFTPNIRAIDFNCGCPIDMVFNSGGGSALLDQQPKLEKILRGMNALSGEIPIQVKVRMGVKDNQPTAAKLAERLILGGASAQQDGLGPCGIAAMTLHGRSRQQRYTRLANWEYIASVSAMIKGLKTKQDAVADTIREADPRDQPNGGKVYFIGNGDVFSPEAYQEHIDKAGVDSIMLARGALIKPWLFEEIQTGKSIDKSSTERLGYIEKFCRYGLDTWGSDEMGIGTTRRFLLEWLSFTHRYIPLGLLEVLPPMINERPPMYKGRDELESLLASDNYQDWIKIR